ncbi:MAG: hypothetical protein WAU53_08965 [Rhodoplanes sp.]
MIDVIDAWLSLPAVGLFAVLIAALLLSPAFYGHGCRSGRRYRRGCAR